METTAKTDIAILLVEDAPYEEGATRNLLRQAGYAQIETAISVDAARAILQQKRFDLVLLDLKIPEREGTEEHQRYGLDLMDDVKASGIPQLVLSQWATVHWVAPVLGRGLGYLRKNDLRNHALLDHAIQVTLAGGTAYSSAPLAMIQALATKSPKAADPNQLSHREKQVVYLFVFKCHGRERSDEKIAEILVIQPQTAATHRKNSMEKLRVHSAAELVAWAHLNPQVFDVVRELYKDIPEAE